ncbi:hypothetical protein [Alkalilacustris brevis]|uniref:hypothetical protein n=1 Tax=Alkalilacustris brevis TaxID=2026338 RepID=UPI000E0DA0DF|nr:hypothetical protein [Alkalilacustris brevis]
MTSPDDPPETLFADHPWHYLPRPALGQSLAVPSMLSDRERRLYTWLTARWMRGAGVVVDLGCFAGGSTASLAQGLVLAGRREPVHAYDRFTLNDAAKQRFLYPAGIKPFEGRDMLALVRRLLAPWESRIELHRGDVAAMRWQGDPIEVLTVDLAKSTALADHIAAQFFPALIPGRSILVQQDYLHDAQPWLPAQMELLARHFQPLAHVAPGSMVFLCRSIPAPDEIEAVRVSGLSDDALLDLLERARRRFRAPAVAKGLAKAMEKLRAHPGARDAKTLRGRAQHRPAKNSVGEGAPKRRG